MTAFLCNAGVVPVGMPCMQSSCCKLFSGATITSGDVVCLHNVDGGSPAFNAAQEHCFLKVPCGDVALVEKYRKIFVPGNFKQTTCFQMDSGGAQKSGSCFFTRNLVCCHLQCCQRQGDMPHPCILATLKGHAISIHSKCLWKTSFGGMHNSRNVLFLLIFLKPAAKPSAGNTSAGFP
jgi:hypothetical protein